MRWPWQVLHLFGNPAKMKVVILEKILYFQSCIVWQIDASKVWFFLHTLFQFGLAIAAIQNTGLINAKYNKTLSGKCNNTLYGTINTNRLNIFPLILCNIFKILKSICLSQTETII